MQRSSSTVPFPFVFVQRFVRKAFVPIHPPGTLSMLPPEAHLGPVDPDTLPKDAVEQTEEEKRIAKARANLPPPEAALNINDIAVCVNIIPFQRQAQIIIITEIR